MLQEVVYEGGMKMLHPRIKRRMHFSDLALDSELLKHLNVLLSEWLKKNAEGSRR